MTKVKGTALAAIATITIAAGALVAERIAIPDPDLRYPIVLLTKMLGIIVTVLLIARVLLLIGKETTTPQGYNGVVNLGRLAVLTAASLIGSAFGVSLMKGKTGSIEYWPLGIVLLFGVLAAYCLKHLWWGWKAFRRLHGEKNTPR